MKVHHFILCIAMTFALNSCGAQKAINTPQEEKLLVQTKFFGAEFGDSPNRVYNRLDYRIPRNRIKYNKEDSSIIIFEQDFASMNWHFVQMKFFEKMLYLVNFQQEFKFESEANKLFEKINNLLHFKYGALELTTNDDGFTYCDTNNNSVTISVHPGTSKGGDTYWYCDLTYYWGAGQLLLYLKSIDEL